MQKFFIGALFVIAGVTAGIWKSEQLRKRHILLGDMIEGLSFMENEIYYTRERLDRIVARVANMSEGDASQFFSIFSEMLADMEEKGAEELWNLAADRSFCWPSPLTERDIEAVSVLGKRLGSTDVEGQRQNIQRTCRELSIRRAEAKIDLEKKGRLYKTLGAAAGAACALLII